MAKNSSKANVVKAGSVKAAVVNRRGNKELQAQCLALTLHSWNNSREDWQRLEAAVTQLGAAAPARAKAALASYQRSMRVLANPFGT
ncbi:MULTISPECIES: hypothetical protein [unclassified Bradyrhizobium]|uniref:hypothetical protein n=1 Tax=unclassified Bradyrhizobium TaxID=2631580 RepID=UPI00291638A1|nr:MULTISPECIES: hypothetical protein [unclassified Bradyrhizobium]